MKIIVSAGGTGGHIYPALAIIEEFKRREPNLEVLYIGTANRMEKDIVPSYGINFKGLTMYGFNRKNLFKNLKTIRYLIKSIKESKKIIKEFKPDVVIGVGGYVTVPIIYAAHKLKVKTAIHEQNSEMGLANKLLSKYVDIVFTSYKETSGSNKIIYSGNPTGSNALNSKLISRTKLGFSEDKKFIVYVMGSLGASKVNEYMFNHINDFKSDKYELLIITGKSSYDKYKDVKVPNNVKVMPYVENLSSYLKDADLMISRAGASTISEIINLRIPTIFIPSPYVPNNHQYKNAKVLEDKHQAIIIEESNVNELVIIVNNLIEDDNKLKTMKESLSKEEIINSGEIIYNNIKEIL
jgi:UDP-N-acetylglucosamine--N-acetylmuramyl-(pentapeptide) pyrophosphoryl-undecaprenol N-acetylglucosamine transferase